MVAVTEQVVAEITKRFESAESILIVTHVGPDGDAIGSLAAMGLASLQLRKSVTLACSDAVPARFRYLELVERIQRVLPADAKFDLVVAVDCGDMRRMGDIYESLPEPKPPIINIDHHITNTHFGDINLVDADATSTAEVLYFLLPRLGVRITPALAQCLLTGLVTDTLGFRTDGVSAGTFGVAHDLLQAGADLPTVMTNALTSKPLSTLLLWKTGLNKMRLEDGLLWTSITNQERLNAGHMGTGSAGLVNLLADAEQAIMGAVLLEYDDGSVYVGFRCRPPYSVSELALNLGGGGHPLAAGCSLQQPLADAERLVVEMSKEAIRLQRGEMFEHGNQKHRG